MTSSISNLIYGKKLGKHPHMNSCVTLIPINKGTFIILISPLIKNLKINYKSILIEPKQKTIL